MKKLLSLLVLAAMLVAPVYAAQTGDPLDGNDRSMGTVDNDCSLAYAYPECGWCWDQCMYALIMDAYYSGGIGWDWGV